jgi:Ca2+-binding RTX toxin-like protein
VTIASGATTALEVPAQIGTLKIYYLTQDELEAGPRPIDAGTAGWNTLMFPTDVAGLPDTAFAGLTDFNEIDLLGTGAQSLALGSNAAAAFGATVVVKAAAASSLNLDATGIGTESLSAYGSPGADTIRGGNGFNWIVGGGGADHLYGGPGNDIIVLEAGQLGTPGFLANGGGGFDEFWIHGANTINDAAFASVTNVQEIDFQDFSAQSLTLGANAGAEAGFGSSGNDTFIGGAGSDYFVAGGGVDSFSAGLGVDFVKDFLPGIDTVHLQSGGLTTFAQVQAAMTQSGADTEINLGGGNQVYLLGIQQSVLSAHDFGM